MFLEISGRVLLFLLLKICVLCFCSLIKISLDKNYSITKHSTILVTPNGKSRCLTCWVWAHILIPSISLSSCGRDFSRRVFFHLMYVLHCVKTLELQTLHIKVSWVVTGNIQMLWLGVSGSVLSPHTIYWAVIYRSIHLLHTFCECCPNNNKSFCKWLTKYGYNPNKNYRVLQIALINIILMSLACWSDTLYQFLCMYPKC